MIMAPWLRNVWRDLIQRLDEDRLPHAILIHGPPGVGKQDLAESFASRLLCLDPRDDQACGVCRSCRLSHPGGAHPDLMSVAPPEDKNIIAVDQIRKLCSDLSLSAAFGGHRISIIRQAELMNVNAANALLKTLEEPGRDVMMMLVASRSGRLPATIRSRCQPIWCPAPARLEAVQWMAEKGHEEELAQMALALAGGAPMLADAWARDGAVAEAIQVRDDLSALAGQGGDLVEIYQRWQDIDGSRLWRWVIHAVHQWARMADGRAINTPSVEQTRLLEMAGEAMQAARLCATPVRGDLQIWQWLLQWQYCVKPQVVHGST